MYIYVLIISSFFQVSNILKCVTGYGGKPGRNISILIKELLILKKNYIKFHNGLP